jgi:hypothetical protein
MNFRKTIVSLSSAVLLGIASMSASANPISAAVEYTTGGTLSDSRAYTLGYEFTLTTSLNINALGYWNDGNTNAHQVGIWDALGQLLVSATVQGSDQLVGHFRYADISDYLLGPGTYVIAGEFLGGGNTFLANAQGVSTVAGLTWNTDLQLSGSGLNFPTLDTGGSYGANGILVATFSVGDSNNVPEPVSLALVGAALCGLAVVSRRKSV